MKKAIVIVEDGIVQDILVNFKERIEIRIIDFDRRTLDQSVIRLLTGPFEDVVSLADVIPWNGEYNPRRVEEVFKAHQQLKDVGYITLNEKDI